MSAFSIYNNYIPAKPGSIFFHLLGQFITVSAYKSDQNLERTSKKLFLHAKPR